MNRLFKFVKLFFQYKWEEIADFFRSEGCFNIGVSTWVAIAAVGWIPIFFFPQDKWDLFGAIWCAIVIAPMVGILILYISKGAYYVFRWIGSNIKRAWEDSK